MSIAGDPNFRITVEQRGEHRTVALAGELDLATVTQFEAAMREQLEAGPVILQLGELSFIDSSGVRALHALLPARAESPPRLSISPVLADNVKQVLQMTGMIDLLLDDVTMPEGGAG